MTIEFSKEYLQREIHVWGYMSRYAKRNKIQEKQVEADGVTYVQFGAKSRFQMQIFGRNVCNRFEFFEFW